MNDNQDWITGPVACGRYWFDHSDQEDWDDDVDPALMENLYLGYVEYNTETQRIQLTEAGQLHLAKPEGTA